MTQVSRARLCILVGCVLAIEALCRTGVISSFSMIPPSEMAIGLANILVAGNLNSGILRTLTDVFYAFASALVIGVSFAVVTHRWPGFRRAIEPIFGAYYAIPVFAFYPLFVVLFGLEGRPQIAIGFLAAVVVIILNTLNGLDRVPRVLLKTARILKFGRLKTAWLVTLPSALPHILAGVKLGVAYSFTGVIGAEFILATEGLGFEISYAYNSFENVVMYSLILLVLLLAATINVVLFMLEANLEKRRLRSR